MVARISRTQSSVSWIASVTLTFSARTWSNTGVMGPRVRYSTAKATGTLQNAAIASCQQKNSDATNTMALAMMAPQSSPSTWL